MVVICLERVKVSQGITMCAHLSSHETITLNAGIDTTSLEFLPSLSHNITGRDLKKDFPADML